MSSQIKKRIAILGCGPAGVAYSWYLDDRFSKDYEVVIWAAEGHDAFAKHIQETGKAKIYGTVNCMADVAIELDLKRALTDAFAVVNTVPCHNDKVILEKMKAAYDVSRITIYIRTPGQYGEELARIVFGDKSPPYTVGTSELAFASVLNREEKSVDFRGIKSELTYAVTPCPPEDIQQHVARLIPSDKLEDVNNTVRLGFETIGARLHVAIVAFNAGRIPGEFYGYGDLSPPVMTVIDKVDKLVVATAMAYGTRVKSLDQFFAGAYQAKGGWREYVKDPAVLHNKTVNRIENTWHRWLDQDTYCVLTVWECLMKAADVDAGPITALIDVAIQLNDYDYRKSGRAAELGLYGKTAGEIYELLVPRPNVIDSDVSIGARNTAKSILCLLLRQEGPMGMPDSLMTGDNANVVKLLKDREFQGPHDLEGGVALLSAQSFISRLNMIRSDIGLQGGTVNDIATNVARRSTNIRTKEIKMGASIGEKDMPGYGQRLAEWLKFREKRSNFEAVAAFLGS